MTGWLESWPPSPRAAVNAVVLAILAMVPVYAALTGDNNRRDDIAGVEHGGHRRLAGNSPSGLATSTIAISR